MGLSLIADDASARSDDDLVAATLERLHVRGIAGSHREMDALLPVLEKRIAFYEWLSSQPKDVLRKGGDRLDRQMLDMTNDLSLLAQLDAMHGQYLLALEARKEVRPAAWRDERIEQHRHYVDVLNAYFDRTNAAFTRIDGRLRD